MLCAKILIKQQLNNEVSGWLLETKIQFGVITNRGKAFPMNKNKGMDTQHTINRLITVITMTTILGNMAQHNRSTI